MGRAAGEDLGPAPAAAPEAPAPVFEAAPDGPVPFARRVQIVRGENPSTLGGLHLLQPPAISGSGAFLRPVRIILAFAAHAAHDPMVLRMRQQESPTT
jgi:hypothetical protein